MEDQPACCRPTQNQSTKLRKGGPRRAMPLRLGKEIQAMLWPQLTGEFSLDATSPPRKVLHCLSQQNHCAADVPHLSHTPRKKSERPIGSRRSGRRHTTLRLERVAVRRQSSMSRSNDQRCPFSAHEQKSRRESFCFAFEPKTDIQPFFQNGMRNLNLRCSAC